MAEKVEEITINFTQDDKLVVRELEKVVLTKGNWTTIMFKYQDLDKRSDTYGAPKVSIRRYQKRNGTYRQQSKFNISSAKQGREVAAILQNWYPADAAGDAAAPAAAAGNGDEE